MRPMPGQPHGCSEIGFLPGITCSLWLAAYSSWPGVFGTRETSRGWAWSPDNCLPPVHPLGPHAPEGRGAKVETGTGRPGFAGRVMLCIMQRWEAAAPAGAQHSALEGKGRLPWVTLVNSEPHGWEAEPGPVVREGREGPCPELQRHWAM